MSLSARYGFCLKASARRGQIPADSNPWQLHRPTFSLEEISFVKLQLLKKTRACRQMPISSRFCFKKPDHFLATKPICIPVFLLIPILIQLPLSPPQTYHKLQSTLCSYSRNALFYKVQPNLAPLLTSSLLTLQISPHLWEFQGFPLGKIRILTVSALQGRIY